MATMAKMVDETASTQSASAAIEGGSQRRVSLKDSAQSVGRPKSKVLADGTEIKQATIKKALTKTVPCDAHGQPLPKDAESTHYKTTFRQFSVEEMRMDGGEYEPTRATVLGGLVQELVLRLGSKGDELLLGEGDKGALVRAAAGVELLVEQRLLSLPQAVTVSFQYTSPHGGKWYVENERVVLSDSESAGGCCTLQ